ncbi:hypothetical protein JCM15457_1442 [Liquorilactobacillus sucicola DSM 21376 = JCM 15457]|nr:hypothetical protein JCM15457_1442 [Liquorilactobacillus sucicola DSM 21376 = JCM 15457]
MYVIFLLLFMSYANLKMSVCGKYQDGVILFAKSYSNWTELWRVVIKIEKTTV